MAGKAETRKGPGLPARADEDARRRLTRETGRHMASTVASVRDLMMWDEYAKFALNGILSNPHPSQGEDEIAEMACWFADIMMEKRKSRVGGPRPPAAGPSAQEPQGSS